MMTTTRESSSSSSANIMLTLPLLCPSSMLKDAGSGALGALTSYARGDLGGVFKSVTSLGSRIVNGDKATKMTKATRSSNADVISFSGCKDDQALLLPSLQFGRSQLTRLKPQTSADTSMAGQVSTVSDNHLTRVLTLESLLRPI